MSASFENFVNDYIDVLKEYRTDNFDNACYRFVLSWSESVDFNTLELVNFFNAADEFILECVPGLSPAEQREFLFVFMKVREKIMPQLQVNGFAHAHVNTKRLATENARKAVIESIKKRKKKVVKWHNEFAAFYKLQPKNKIDSTVSDSAIIQRFIDLKKGRKGFPTTKDRYYKFLRKS